MGIFLARAVQKRVGRWRAGNKIPADAGAKLLEITSGNGDTVLLFERYLVIGDLISMRAIPLEKVQSVEARGAVWPQIRVHYSDDQDRRQRVTQTFAYIARSKIEETARKIEETVEGTVGKAKAAKSSPRRPKKRPKEPSEFI